MTSLGDAFLFCAIVAIFGLAALLVGAGFFVASFFLPVSATTAAISMGIAGLAASWGTKRLFAD